VLLAAVVAPLVAHAVEPAEEFIRGLQERELNELALDYLEQLQHSKLIDDDFRRNIPYHRGVVLLEQSRQTADPTARARLLDEAQTELRQFAEANPENVQGAEAQLQLANVQMTLGQQIGAKLTQLPSEPAYRDQRETMGRQARALFGEARETFGQAETTYSTELEKLPPTSSEPKDASGSKRQEYRARVAQLQFLAAQAQFEAAQTHSPDDDEFRELNEAAAAELAAVYEEFARTFIVGLYARLYEGRCYQAIGSHQLALGCFEDILEQPNVLPPFRKLIASAVHRKAEVLIAQEEYDAAIDACTACLKDAKSEDEKQPEWLAVRFRLAEAQQRKGESLSGNSAERRKLLAEARDAYRFVASSPGEFQTVARKMASSLVGNNNAEKSQPRTFQAAYDLGKDALASYNAAKLASPTAQKNNPEALPELEVQMKQGKDDARRYFRAATTLVDDDTDPKLLNEVRYFLCWLYWESEDYYRAAVLGEFLARRYPDHSAAASAAKLAMASYERLYGQAVGGSRSNSTDFEAKRMAQMAEFIARRWPGTADADAAQSVLVSYAIRNNRIDDAVKLLADASEQSRPRLELQLGNAMWGRFVELSQGTGDARPDPAELSRLKDAAVKYLRNGVDAARGERQTSDSVAAASLYLVQALLNDEHYDNAIELLEDEQLGPLSLMSQKHPAATRPQYVVEAYKAALRAYVLVTPPQDTKAAGIIKSLEKSMAASGGNEAQLTQIYIVLGVALDKQANQLRQAGRDRDAARINATFAQFLDRIAARQADANWPTRAWLAQTYYNMGAGERSVPSSAPPKPLSEAARTYLTKSRAAYQQLLDDADKNPKLAPSKNSVLAARLQLGECLRALGQYKQALDTFSSILKENETSLAVQRAAANTYQQRGQVEDPKWFEYAIHGGYELRSTGKKRIWGWLKISQAAARAARADEKHRDTFYEARLNIARCRYMSAMKQSGNARAQNLAKAKQSIQSLTQLYPDLGGERWRAEFDALLKQIQTSSDQKPVGLREFSNGKTSAR
jgi:hypothetical protein